MLCFPRFALPSPPPAARTRRERCVNKGCRARCTRRHGDRTRGFSSGAPACGIHLSSSSSSHRVASPLSSGRSWCKSWSHPGGAGGRAYHWSGLEPPWREGLSTPLMRYYPRYISVRALRRDVSTPRVTGVLSLCLAPTPAPYPILSCAVL